MTESKKNKNATIKKSSTKKASTKKVSVKKKSAKKVIVKKGKANKQKQKASSNNKVVENKQGHHIVLNSATIINEIKVLHADLLQLSKSDEMVTLDVSKVEMIDTAAMQLLVAFVATMNNKNVKVEWINPSVVFLERISTLGLNDALCLSEANA